MLPSDYDDDPGRYAANQLATHRFLGRQDAHPEVARRFADDGRRLVVDIGGGNGTLAQLLNAEGIGFVVVDRAAHVAQAPRPGVRADACQLPFGGGTFDGAAALWMLYHLLNPLAALREAHRVLCPGGLLAVAAPSRRNDPELASVLPGWGEPLSFDAENGPALLGQVFDVVDIQQWDTPWVRVPDRAGLALYLRGRGLAEEHAHSAARRLDLPMIITKRGMIGWARKAHR